MALETSSGLRFLFGNVALFFAHVSRGAAGRFHVPARRRARCTADEARWAIICRPITRLDRPTLDLLFLSSFMVFRLRDNVPRVTRHDLADSNRHLTLEERLIAADAQDLRDNTIIVDEGDGYVSILPRDPTKRWVASSPASRQSDPHAPGGAPISSVTGAAASPAGSKESAKRRDTSRRRRRT